jgi:hypothetical protein
MTATDAPPSGVARTPPGVASTAQGTATHPAPWPAPRPAAAPADPRRPQAEALVRQFYQRFYGLTQVTPGPKELTHATALLATYGEAKAQFLLVYEQLLRSSRQNLSPVKRRDRSLLMRHEHAARALVKLCRSGKHRPAPIRSFLTRQKPSMGFRWGPHRAGSQDKRNCSCQCVSVDASWCARWMPLRSTTITTSVPVWPKSAITCWREWRNPSGSHWGTIVAKTFAVP